MAISARELLKSVIGSKPAASSKPKSTKEKRSPLKNKYGDEVKFKPWNKCPKCETLLAFQMMLPPSHHEKQLDGSVKLVSVGEATYECKFCHYEKSAVSV